MAVVKTLETIHAAAVARLEREIFPENLRNGRIKIKGMVLNNERFQSGLTIGLFDKSNLVGYHLAYPQGFRNAGQSKYAKKVYLSDFAVIPAYRNYVNEIQGLALSRAISVFPSRPLITDAFEVYKDKWLKREPFFRSHGYTLIQCDRIMNARFDRDVFRILWKPTDTILHTVKEKYQFKIQPHMIHYLFQIFFWIANLIGLNGRHV